MKRNRKRVLATTGIAAIGALVATALIVVLLALATTPSRTSFTLLAPVAQFSEIDAKAKFGADWKAEIKTKGASDLHITEVTIQSGGHGSWHSHPGPSFIIVKSGTISFYDGDDPTCTAQVVGSFRSGRRRAHRPQRIQRTSGRGCGPARCERGATAERRAEPRQLPVLGQR